MSLHSATCTVIINSPPTKGYYTDGDLITGCVEIDVQREITVASIEAQLRCEDRGRAYAQDNRDVVDLSVAHKDVTEVLWESEPILFALPEDNRLSKGKHKFPFKFELPHNTHYLPSSYAVEANHDFNGTFWGVAATIDRDQKIRSNYRGFEEINVYPRRERCFTGDDDSFKVSTHTIHVRLHRRPSFLLQENDKATVGVEGKVAIPKGGLIQSRAPVDKEGSAGSDIRLAVRSLSDDENVLIKEIIVFVDTTIVTTAQGVSSETTAVAIAFSTKCDDIVKGSEGWHDLSHYVADTRIYGLVETFSTNIHKYSHALRVQFLVAPENRPGRVGILEVSIPLTLHSEVTTTSNGHPHEPPPYCKYKNTETRNLV